MSNPLHCILLQETNTLAPPIQQDFQCLATRQRAPSPVKILSTHVDEQHHLAGYDKAGFSSAPPFRNPLQHWLARDQDHGNATPLLLPSDVEPDPHASS